MSEQYLRAAGRRSAANTVIDLVGQHQDRIAGAAAVAALSRSNDSFSAMKWRVGISKSPLFAMPARRSGCASGPMPCCWR